MSITFTCPACDRKLQMANAPAPGKRVKCKCGNIFAPQPAASPANAAAGQVDQPLMVTCPNCNKKLRVSSTMRGKKVKCPGCSSVFGVPAREHTAVASGPPAGARDSSRESANISRKPQGRAAPPPIDDDEVDRPRPKKKKSKAKKGMGPVDLVAGGILIAYFALLIMALTGVIPYPFHPDDFSEPKMSQGRPFGNNDNPPFNPGGNNDNPPFNPGGNNPPNNNNPQPPAMVDAPKKNNAAEQQRAAQRDSQRVALKKQEEQVIIPALAKLPPPKFSRGELAIFKAGNSLVSEVEFSPDGKLLATRGKDIYIWDLQTGKMLRVLKTDQTTRTMAFSPDGKTIASSDILKKNVTLWDVNTGQIKNTLVSEQNIFEVDFSPDGKLLAGAEGGYSLTTPIGRLWDTGSGTTHATLTSPFSTGLYSARKLAFSSTGRILATGHINKNVVAWDLDKRAPFHMVYGSEDVRALAFSPDGWHLAVGSDNANNGTVVVDNLVDRKQAFRSFLSHRVDDLAYTPDGKSLVICHGAYANPPLTFLDAKTGNQIQRLSSELIQGAQSVAFSPGGSMVALGGQNSSVYIWKTKDLLDSSLQAIQQLVKDFKKWSYIQRKGPLYYVDVYGDARPNEIVQLAKIPNIGGIELEFNDNITNKDLAFLSDLKKLQELKLDGLNKITDAGLAPIKDCTELRKLELIALNNLTDDGLKYAGGLTKLENVKLRYLRKITNDGLKNFAGMSGMQSLDIESCSGITDAGMAHLAGLTKLKLLYLHGTNVTHAGLVHIKNMKEMEKLGLGGITVTDAGMEHLQDMTDMSELNLYGTFITDKGLANVKNMTAMTRLTLTNNKSVTSAGMAHLANMTQMKQLYLRNTKVGDEGMAHLVGMKNLEQLDISGTDVTDNGFAHLAGMTNLKTLDLHNLAGLKGPGLAHLKNLAKIRSLYLRNTAIDDDGFAAVKELTFLTDLECPKGITDAGLAHVAGLSNLYSLNISGIKGITGPGLQHLNNLPKINSLNLVKTGVTDENLKYVAGLDQLRSIVLPKQISDAGVAHLKSLPNLESIDLLGTKVTDAGLKHLYGMTKLRNLYLEQTKVTDAAINALKTALPKLNVTK